MSFDFEKAEDLEKNPQKWYMKYTIILKMRRYLTLTISHSSINNENLSFTPTT